MLGQWIQHISAQLQPGRQQIIFTLTGEAFEGRALGTFSGAIGEAVQPPGTPGQHGVQTPGGWMQAQINLTNKWQTNLAYGIEVPNASQLPVGNRSRNRTYMGAAS